MKRLSTLVMLALGFCYFLICGQSVLAQDGITAKFETTNGKEHATYAIGSCIVSASGNPPVWSIQNKQSSSVQKDCDALFENLPDHVSEQLRNRIPKQVPLPITGVLAAVFQYDELSFRWLHNTADKHLLDAFLLTSTDGQARKSTLGMEQRYNTAETALNANSWHQVKILKVEIEGATATVTTSETFYWESNIRVRDHKENQQQVYKLVFKNGFWLVDYNAPV